MGFKSLSVEEAVKSIENGAPFSIDLTASSTLNDLKPINDGLSFQ